MLTRDEEIKRKELLDDLAAHRALRSQIKFKLTQTYLRACHYEESLEFTDATIRMIEKEIAKLGQESAFQSIIDWLNRK